MARHKPQHALEPRLIAGLFAGLALLCLTAPIQRLPGGTTIDAILLLVAVFVAGAACSMLLRPWWGTGPASVAVPAQASGGRPSQRGWQPVAGPRPAATPPLAADGKTASIISLPLLPRAAIMPGDGPRAPEPGTGERLPLQGVYPGMPPAAFAAFCVTQLTRAGWRVRLTAHAPDGAGSLVAERNGNRAALLCTIASGAVGYRAVRDAAMARAEAGAAIGIVVSDSLYTAAAQHFAADHRILLLHHRDLPGLDRVLARGESRMAAAAG